MRTAFTAGECRCSLVLFIHPISVLRCLLQNFIFELKIICMKQSLLLITGLFLYIIVTAQNVGIGTTTPNVNAALEIKSNNKGFLPARLSTAARTAMTNIAKGMMVYDTTLANFYYHDGSSWKLFSEQNVDSLTRDYLGTPAETVNMTGVGVITTASSGILYDNGGPAGNYSNNQYTTYIISDENVDSLVGYKIIVEQMNLAANDAFGIAVADDQANPLILTGTTTGTYYFPGTASLIFILQSDAAGNAPGFRVRWSKVTVNRNTADIAPAYGWYFNASKIAVRGGIAPNGNWIADSLGRTSFAYGLNAKAKGKGAIAMGSYVSAAGANSQAFGYFNTASGDNATAVGRNSKATGNTSFAAGLYAETSAESAVAIGGSVKASGFGSVAIGYGSTASADYAVALGQSTVASQINATSTGNETIASGESSFASGIETTASGVSSFSGGQQTLAQGNSALAFGRDTRALGDQSVALGFQTTADSYGAVVIGRNNKIVGIGTKSIWNNVDPLFTLANGSNSTPNNIMTVFKNGRIGIGTDNPAIGFHIGVGSDAGLADGTGYMVLGDINGSNLVFDNNEIVARNNGANNTLFLQYDGGALEIGGTAAKPGGGSWSATSDARLKQHVKPYEDGLAQVLKINPVYFNYNERSGYDTSKQYVGIIAQELKEVAPYMVDSFKKDGTDYYKADNTSMTYMLINAMKEQQKMIETQQQQINELKTLLNAQSKNNSRK